MVNTGFFNSIGTIFAGLLGRDTRKSNNAIIVSPTDVFTGEFPKIVPKEIFYEKYHSFPQIKAAINSTGKKMMGSDIEVTSQNPALTDMLEEWCKVVSFKKKLELFVLDTLITGDGFLELQFTEDSLTVPNETPRPHLANIAQIPTKTFFKIHRDIHANVLKYTQNVAGILLDLDPQFLIHWAINNPDNEAFGKSEFYAVAAPRSLLSKVDPNTNEAINTQRFVAPILDMQARNLHAEMEYKEKMAKGRIIVTARNMPKEQQDKLKNELNDPSSEKTFWVFGGDIAPEDISVQEAGISPQSKLDRYTDNINREIDLDTQISSKIATDPGSFSFASSQTPLQELAERISSRQTEVSEMVQQRIFSILAEQWGFDPEEEKPELVFKPFLKKVDLEQLNNIDPARLSDSEYRDAIRDIITLDDDSFEKEKEEKKQLAVNTQRGDKEPAGDIEQPEEIESQRPTTEHFKMNPKLFDNYVKELVASEVIAVTATGAGGGLEPLDRNNQKNARLASLQRLHTDPPVVTDEEVLDKFGLDEDDEESKEQSKTTFGGFDTLQECVEANTGIEEDPEGYCKMHTETKEGYKAKK